MSAALILSSLTNSVRQSLNPPEIIVDPVPTKERAQIQQALDILTDLTDLGYEGRKWIVTIMKAGLSLDKIHYFPADVLKHAVDAGMFNQLKCFQFEFDGRTDHLSFEKERQVMPSGLFKNYVGYVDDVHYDEATQSVKGTMLVLDKVAGEKLALLNAGGVKHCGLSIVAQCEKVPMILSSGATGAKVVAFLEVSEVDIVSFPAAGGEFERLVASIALDKLEVRQTNSERPPDIEKSNGGSTMNPELLKRIMQALSKVVPGAVNPATSYDTRESVLGLLDSIKLSDVKQAVQMDGLMKLRDVIANSATREDAVTATETLIAEMETGSVNLSKDHTAPAPAPSPAVVVDTQARKELDELKQSIKVSECNAILESRLVQSLPGIGEKAVDSLRKRFRGTVFTPKALDESIVEMADIRGVRMSTGGHVQVSGPDMVEKIQMGLDLMIGYQPTAEEKSKYEGAIKFRGLRQSFQFCTGDDDVRGYKNLAALSGDTRQAMLSTNYPLLLANSMTKRLSQDYARRSADWRQLVRVKPLNDFKTQEITRWGGFADLPEITPENSDYTYLANPAEEKATYSAKTYGGLVEISRKTMKNDDLKFVQDVPERLAAIANKKLWQFVSDLITNWDGVAINGGLITLDGTALYTVGHGNLIAQALSYDALRDIRVKMRSQKETGSNEVLDIRPKFLVVPVELEPLANSLINSEVKPGATNGEINIHRNKLVIVENPYLREDDNVFLVADPSTVETIEIGFMDGKEEPELILQNGDTEGNTFLRDSWTYKGRHEYGGSQSDVKGLAALIAP